VHFVEKPRCQRYYRHPWDGKFVVQGPPVSCNAGLAVSRFCGTLRHNPVPAPAPCVTRACSAVAFDPGQNLAFAVEDRSANTDERRPTTTAPKLCPIVLLEPREAHDHRGGCQQLGRREDRCRRDCLADHTRRRTAERAPVSPGSRVQRWIWHSVALREFVWTTPVGQYLSPNNDKLG
jgi:hypothetical protein